MEPAWFDCRLRLEDRWGHKRWTRIIERNDTPALAERLLAAVAFVEPSEDPRGPELVVLRHLVQLQVRGSDGPSVTPSQLKPAEAEPAAVQAAPDEEFERDVAAQAATLILAAKNGIPFCEECAAAAQKPVAQQTHDG